jgi:hypothetical protein
MLFGSYCSAADYKCTLLKVEAGKSITVKLDGKERMFKLDDKTEYIKPMKDGDVKVDGGELTTALRFFKGGMDIEITTKGEKDDEVVAKLVFMRPKETPKAKDAPPNAPGELKGVWELDGTSKGGQSTTLGRGGPTLVFSDNEVEWAKEIPLVFKEKGKGTITIDTKKTPKTIEVKIGDAVYKGVWKIIPPRENSKKEWLKMVLSPANGDIPAEVLPDALRLPRDFQGVQINAYREIK